MKRTEKTVTVIETEGYPVGLLDTVVASTKHEVKKKIPKGYKELPSGPMRWIKVNREVMGEPCDDLYENATNRESVLQVFEGSLDSSPTLYGEVIIDGESSLDVVTESRYLGGCGGGEENCINGVAIKTTSRLLVK